MTDSSDSEGEDTNKKRLEGALEKAEDEITRLNLLLNEWHQRVLDKISPSEASDIVYKEQINSITYYLLKTQARVQQLEEELTRTRRELEEVKKIFKPRGTEQADGVKHREAGLETEDSKAGQRISAGEILSEDELAGLLGLEKLHQEFKHRETKSIRDFIDLLIRLQRVKVVDASILLNVDKALMNIWIEKLKRKRLIQIEGGRDPVLLCTDSLVRVRRMMK